MFYLSLWTPLNFSYETRTLCAHMQQLLVFFVKSKYVILGLLKFCTFGFMLIWTLIDILLIALQVNELTAFWFWLFIYLDSFSALTVLVG